MAEEESVVAFYGDSTAISILSAPEAIEGWDTGGLIGVPVSFNDNSIPVGRIYREIPPTGGWIRCRTGSSSTIDPTVWAASTMTECAPAWAHASPHAGHCAQPVPRAGVQDRCAPWPLSSAHPCSD